MAYNSYFPASYQPMFYPQYQQQNQAAVQQQQIQNGGLVSVRNRAEAEGYPVAPGNSVTFKDETSPYIYVKTMGFSQLDRPSFDTFRLVKEDEPTMPEKSKSDDVPQGKVDLTEYVKKAEFEAFSARLEALEDKLTKKTKKKEVSEDE